jgi:hypothetical protein
MALNLPELWALEHAAAFLHASLAAPDSASHPHDLPSGGTTTSGGATTSGGTTASGGATTSGDTTACGGVTTTSGGPDSGVAWGVPRSATGVAVQPGEPRRRVLLLAFDPALDALVARMPDVTVAGALEARAAGRLDSALWVYPTASWARQLAELRRSLAPGAPLVMVVRGRLADRGVPSSRVPQGGVLVRHAQRLGFRIERILGFGSPTTLAAAAAVRGARIIGRLDLADRAETAYRLSVRPTAGWRLSLCSVVLARA